MLVVRVQPPKLFVHGKIAVLLFIFLPDKYYFGLMKYEQYIKIAFLVALYLGIISIPLEFVADAISDVMSFIIELIPGL
jgi:hypothetical protein